MDRYSMLPNIVEHSYRVCQVASFLGKALSGPGKGLDPALIVASSLLHDITKTRSLKTKEQHAAREGACSRTWDTRRSQRWSEATYGSRTETRSSPPVRSTSSTTRTRGCGTIR